MALLVRLVFTSHMVPSVLPTSSEPLQQQMLTDTEKNNDINISLRPPLRFLAPPRQNALQIYNNILQSYVCIKLLCGGFDRHSYIYIYVCIIQILIMAHVRSRTTSLKGQPRPGMQGGYQLLSQLSSGCSRACPDAV